MVSASQAVRSVHINPSHTHLLLLPMHLRTIIIHPLFSPSPALLQRLSFTCYTFKFTCSLSFSPAVRSTFPSPYPKRSITNAPPKVDGRGVSMPRIALRPERVVVNNKLLTGWRWGEGVAIIWGSDDERGELPP